MNKTMLKPTTSNFFVRRKNDVNINYLEKVKEESSLRKIKKLQK